MAIVISAHKEGFRRLGIAHSKTPTRFPDDYFKPHELETLKSDPYLVVHEIDDEHADKQEIPHAENLPAKSATKAKAAAKAGAK